VRSNDPYSILYCNNQWHIAVTEADSVKPMTDER